jgi:hypothetical protein
VFARQYSRGANTRAVSDTRVLRAWLAGGGEPPDVSDFNITAEDLIEVDDGNEIVSAGIACLLIKRGARDWARSGSGPMRLDALEPAVGINVHHLFPKDVVSGRDRKWRYIEDIPANQTPVSESVNKSIRNQAPSVVVKSKKIDTGALPDHLVDVRSFTRDEYERFIPRRAEALAEAIKSVVRSG